MSMKYKFTTILEMGMEMVKGIMRKPSTVQRVLPQLVSLDDLSSHTTNANLLSALEKKFAR